MVSIKIWIEISCNVTNSSTDTSETKPSNSIIPGINKGSAIFLHLLRELAEETGAVGPRRVAFYHRNSSDSRKQDILADLQLPLDSSEKSLLCVVATVSLGMFRCTSNKLITPQYCAGVGVDIKINNVVIFGLPETPENFLQEAGRAMRGSSVETKGKQGFAFFFHKGSLGMNVNNCKIRTTIILKPSWGWAVPSSDQLELANKTWV